MSSAPAESVAGRISCELSEEPCKACSGLSLRTPSSLPVEEGGGEDVLGSLDSEGTGGDPVRSNGKCGGAICPGGEMECSRRED